MGYLDGSSLQEASEGLVAPTMDEFMARAGEPVLSFSVSDPVIDIPKGILNCCRVQHQPHCASYVAGTLLGCFYTLRFPDGEVRERVPDKQSFDGDALFDYERLASVVQVCWMMVRSTAESLGAEVTDLRFDVWTFNLEDWEAWRFLRQQQERERAEEMAAQDGLTDDQIRALHVYALQPEECTPPQISKLLASDGFVPAVAYADRVELFPSEVGHDDHQRYVTSMVWGEEGVVAPAVDALNEVPETEDPTCQQATPSTSS